MSLIMILSINEQPDIRCSATTNPPVLAKERYATTQLIGTLETVVGFIKFIPKWPKTTRTSWISSHQVNAHCGCPQIPVAVPAGATGWLSSSEVLLLVVVPGCGDRGGRVSGCEWTPKLELGGEGVVAVMLDPP